MNLATWKEAGRRIAIEGHEIFVIEAGQSNDTIVILHGYPTSSFDYAAVLPALSRDHRVVIHDHIGFGLSDKPADYSYSLIEQTDRALLLWRELGIERAHVVAHDYGTSIATELIARRNMGFEPVDLASLTLCNGSVHIELAKLKLIQKLLRHELLGPLAARLSSRRMFGKNMRDLWHDASTLTEAEIDTMWELLTRADGKRAIPRITQYLRERERYWHRWVGALRRSDLRALILWGDRDPIVGGDIARVHHQEMPNSTLRILDDVGHYPMIEAPERWASELLDFITTPGAPRLETRALHRDVPNW